VSRLFQEAKAINGQVDVVVHSAGIMPMAKITPESLPDFDKVIHTNLRGSFLILAHAAETVPDGGRIIALSTSVIAKSFPAYGPYIASKAGVEGLVHVSEMDHTNKNIHPSKVVQIGDEVDVMVLEVDEERRRISLGIKQTRANPWEEFAKSHEKGEKVSGTIKSITDFGIFIGLNGGIDGLVHLSDISWNEQGEEAIRRYKKGDTVEAVILSVDAEGNRISLGIKQLNSDPFNDFLAANERGALVKGTVTAVDARGATVKLADEVEATLKASEINRDRVEDATKFLEVGQEVEAKIINVDRKSRAINLSIKAKDEAEEKEAVANLRTASASQENGPKTIGDLIKAQMK